MSSYIISYQYVPSFSQYKLYNDAVCFLYEILTCLCRSWRQRLIAFIEISDVSSLVCCPLLLGTGSLDYDSLTCKGDMW